MGQNLLDTDSFNGTNGNTLSTYNANWVADDTGLGNEVIIAGTPGIGSDGFQDENYRTGQTWTNDQWCELKVDGTTLASDDWLIGVRMATTNILQGYMAGYSPAFFGTNNYGILRYDSRVGHSLATSSTARATNDVVNFQVQATTLTLTLNGSVLLTVTDTTYTTGNPAIRLLHTSSGVRLGGTWRAGSVSSGGLFTASNPMTGLGVGGNFFANPLG